MRKAELAERYVAVAKERNSLAGSRTLNSGDYTVRANALIEALAGRRSRDRGGAVTGGYAPS